MTLKEKIENNIVFWLLSTAVAGFVAGFSAYQVILEIAKLEVVPRVELVKLKMIKPFD